MASFLPVSVLVVCTISGGNRIATCTIKNKRRNLGQNKTSNCFYDCHVSLFTACFAIIIMVLQLVSWVL